VLTGLGLSVSSQDHVGWSKCESRGYPLWDSSNGIGVTFSGTQSGIDSVTAVNSMDVPVPENSVCGIMVLSYSDTRLMAWCQGRL
jgi:hypothetical protein